MTVRRKIVGGVLAAVAASGLMFAASPLAAAVTEHKHCVLTPTGWVLVAEGLTMYAPNDPALEQFHSDVHRGEPGEQLDIRAIFPPYVEDDPCSVLDS